MKRRRIGWYAAATILGVVLIYRLAGPEPVEVDAVEAVVAPLRVTVGDEGVTRVRDRHLVTAPVAGRLQRILLEPGDSVAPGTVVARLVPLPLDPRSRREAEAAIQAALDHERMTRAAAAQVRVAWDQSRRDAERARRLVQGGGIASADLERLELTEQARAREVEAAEFRARAAAHEVEAARGAMEAAGAPAAGQRAVELRAPAAGSVLAVPEPSERVVQPGTLLLELGDPSCLEVVVDVLSTDAVQVRAGDRMTVTGWGGNTALDARVRRVEPSGFTKISALGVEEQRVNVIGELIQPPAGLGDRFRVEVHVELWAADSVLQAPASAVFRRGDEWAVFLIAEGRARERVVVVGHQSSTAVEILDGLQPGQLVVRHPTERVKDGVRVSARPTGRSRNAT